MQSETVALGGSLFEYITRPVFTYGVNGWKQTGETTTSGVYSRAQFRKVLNAAPLVRGDGKNPNPHSFTLIREKAPQGRLLTITGSKWPVPSITRTEVSGYFGVAPAYDRCSYPIPMSSYQKTKYDLDYIPTNARQKCLQKLWENVKKSEVSISTTVGEGRESLKMMRDIASHALKIKRKLILHAMQNEVLKRHGAKRKRKKFPSSGQIRAAAGELPTTVAGLWLGWSVGLAPLISDCENIRNHSWTSHPLEFAVKARASHSMSFDTGGVGTVSTVSELCRLEERVQMGAVFKIVDPEAWEVWRTGVTLRPTLAWELTTLSFVVDYFVQIGGYLACLEAALASNGFEYVSGYETTSRKYEQHKSVTVHDTGAIDYSTKTEQSVGHVEMSRTIVDFKRVIRSSAPLPYRPVVKIPSASTALLNCAALLQLLFLSKR